MQVLATSKKLFLMVEESKGSLHFFLAPDPAIVRTDVTSGAVPGND
jgi:hypothetical protein